MSSLPSIVTAIIVSNVLLSFIGFKNQSFFKKYQFQMGKIKAGEQIRMWSSGFLHVDFNHLFINMLSLYFFAGYVVYSLGEMKFLALYLSSLYIGNYLSFLYHNQQNEYTAVGASGAVSGIVYSAVLLYPDMKNVIDLFSHTTARLYHGKHISYLHYLRNEKTRRQHWPYSSFWRCFGWVDSYHSICSQCIDKFQIYIINTGFNPNYSRIYF